MRRLREKTLSTSTFAFCFISLSPQPLTAYLNLEVGENMQSNIRSVLQMHFYNTFLSSSRLGLA